MLCMNHLGPLHFHFSFVPCSFPFPFSFSFSSSFFFVKKAHVYNHLHNNSQIQCVVRTCFLYYHLPLHVIITKE